MGIVLQTADQKTKARNDHIPTQSQIYKIVKSASITIARKWKNHEK